MIRAVQADRTRWEVLDDSKAEGQQLLAIADSQEMADALVRQLEVVGFICHSLGGSPGHDMGGNSAMEKVDEIQYFLKDRGLIDLELE